MKSNNTVCKGDSSAIDSLCYIPIATVTSSIYLRHTLIMIWSVVLSRSTSSFYHFFLLHNSLNLDDLFWLKEHTKALNYCKLTVIDVREWQKENSMEDCKWDGKVPCLSLLCPYIFSDIEKILMLDGDLVVLRDVAELFQTDIGNAYLGGVLDLDFVGQWSRGNREYHRYYTQEVPLSNPSCYYQSGVLLMNLHALRENYPPMFFYEIAHKRKFRYDDQDILNYYCAGHFFKLDYRWNVIHDNNHYRIRYLMQFVQENEYNAYISSRMQPYIVHYAGDQKPWNSKNCDLYDYYWDVVKRTPFSSEYPEPSKDFEPLLKRLLKMIVHETIRAANLARLILSQLKESNANG